MLLYGRSWLTRFDHHPGNGVVGAGRSAHIGLKPDSALAQRATARGLQADSEPSGEPEPAKTKPRIPSRRDWPVPLVQPGTVPDDEKLSGPRCLREPQRAVVPNRRSINELSIVKRSLAKSGESRDVRVRSFCAEDQTESVRDSDIDPHATVKAEVLAARFTVPPADPAAHVQHVYPRQVGEVEADAPFDPKTYPAAERKAVLGADSYGDRSGAKAGRIPGCAFKAPLRHRVFYRAGTGTLDPSHPGHDCDSRSQVNEDVDVEGGTPPQGGHIATAARLQAHYFVAEA